MRGHRDLVAVSGLSVICAILVLVLPLEGLRIVFAIPLCLLLPGYAITAAAFVDKPLPAAQRAVFSLALSLCALALGSLLLNYVGGLRAGTWALFLSALVIVLCQVASSRRLHPGQRPKRFHPPRPPLAQVLLIVAGVGAATVAVGLAFAVLPAKNAIGSTELWIATDANTKTAVVRVGVRSQEQDERSYFLQIRVGAKEEPVIQLFNLQPGESRTLRVRVPAPLRTTAVAASLFRQSDPELVYRRVNAFIPGALTE